ncbi:MAG TPA: hypothetical protein VKI65_05860 [Gemmataceae bacterium]|nr:hypothetical protein [Gemmataceae bacterium]
MAICIVLYAIPAVVVTRAVTDWDIWWHLRTGQWVLEHHAVTTTDPFSSYGEDKSWAAYSWLFEVLVYGLYQWFGLYGVILYRAVMSFAIVASLHRLVAKREPRFLPATLLTGLGVVALIPLMNERPWLFTILFTTWTVDAILDLRAGTAKRWVWLLPLVFAVWANVHIQFIYGLILLVAACAAPVADRYLNRSALREAFSPNGTDAGRLGSPAWWKLVALTAACGAATLLNPYHAQLYAIVLEYATRPGPYQVVIELTALDFRAPWDWAGIVLAFAAVFALGRRAKLSTFDVLLLAAGVFLAFRARRDLWFMVVVASAILATSSHAAARPEELFPLTRLRLRLVAAAVVLVMIFTACVRNLTPSGLQDHVEKMFPVRAVAFVKEQGYGGPLYNHFNWGGYLIWALPDLPVAIDGRTNLHGDERILRFENTWKGMKGWETDADLADANVIIAYANAPLGLTSLLYRDSRFELVYEDEVAVVFVRKK